MKLIENKRFVETTLLLPPPLAGMVSSFLEGVGAGTITVYIFFDFLFQKEDDEK